MACFKEKLGSIYGAKLSLTLSSVFKDLAKVKNKAIYPPQPLRSTQSIGSCCKKNHLNVRKIKLTILLSSGTVISDVDRYHWNLGNFL